ncbi:MAG: purine-nucleoside phosphorylase [Spirochaetales bacterium]|nr:purine-nucleoside phosphorylase [Spirochaetales bacterium]
MASIKRKCSTTVEVGIILGSGLGEFVDAIGGTVIPFPAIAGFPVSRIRGHRRTLKIANGLAVFAGRFHLYEGIDMDDVVLPVFILRALGVHTIIVTNAAGGINPSFCPGDLVLIRDHINLMGTNPLIGPHFEELGLRFPDMSDAYSRELRENVRKCGSCDLKEGVYAALSGPTYETRAEVRMLRLLGADMVGMSTVPEVIAASFLGMSVLGISCISNMAAGIERKHISHDDVLAAGKKAGKNFCRLVFSFIENLGINPV